MTKLLTLSQLTKLKAAKLAVNRLRVEHGCLPISGRELTRRAKSAPSTWDLAQFARHYVETIQAPANAWGQHISKIFGCGSSYIMFMMFTKFGEDQSNAAIDQAYKESHIEIDLYPLAWQAVAAVLRTALKRDNLDSQTRVYLVDALDVITEALEEEAERQALRVSYPEGD